MHDGDGTTGRGGRPPRETPAERRARRAAVDDVREVLDAAARLLEARQRSVAEVRRRLTSAGWRPGLVEEAIGRLVAMGYLDDVAFARAWVESRDRARPRGEHALRRELGFAGVERDVVDGTLAARREEATAADAPGDAATDPEDAAAERLLRRRLAGILREADARKRRQRAYGLLARSGFAPDVCDAVSRRVLADAANAGMDPGAQDDAGSEDA